MKAYHTLIVGGQEYKLRLTASAIMAIEKKLGKSLFTALENIEDNMIETIATILWGVLQPLNPDTSFDTALGLIDQYVDDGHILDDLINELHTLFEASGFFSKGQAG